MVCPACFSKSYDATICHSCGYDSRIPHCGIALPIGTLLKNGEYQIGKLLGKPGGFGLTYLGFNIQLETKVAIKEYLPLQIAGRGPGTLPVSVHAAENSDVFGYGLKSFLDEARTLAQLRHDNIIRVHAFFQENSTAYMVMEYLEGQSLAEYLAKVGKIKHPDAVALFLPVLEGLAYIHQKNILHRDIKPANIYLTEEGKAILLDFGSARQSIQERSQTLTAILTPGFAPWEQYHRKGKQGPWTDVYACAATLYYMITGLLPPDGAERAIEESIEPIETLVQDVDTPISQAISRGLAVKIEERTPTAFEFKQELLEGSNKSVAHRDERESKPAKLIPLSQKNHVSKLRSLFFRFVLSAIVCTLIGLGAIEAIITPRQFSCEEALAYTGGLGGIKKAAQDRIIANDGKIQQIQNRRAWRNPNEKELFPYFDAFDEGLTAIEKAMIESDKQLLALTEQSYCADSYRAKTTVSRSNEQEKANVLNRKDEARNYVAVVSLVLSFGITWLNNRRR